MRAGRLLRAMAASGGSSSSGGGGALQHVRAMVAVGMRREFAPWWPLPLPAALPHNVNKHTLVLDIDETLLHTYGMSAHTSPPSSSPAHDDTHAAAATTTTHAPLVNYHVLLRPHVQTFLREVSELFEVVFWTAGTASYCAAVLGALECDVLQLPPSFYHYREMLKEAAVATRPPTLTVQSIVGRRRPQNNSRLQSAATGAGGGGGSKATTSDDSAENKNDGDNDDGDNDDSSNDDGSGSRRANFYALSRSQTLQRLAYMKYLPMLGRPLRRVLMVDDNVRSFPLHPRHGVRVSSFDVDDEVMQRYMNAVAYVEQQQEEQEQKQKQQASAAAAAAKDGGGDDSYTLPPNVALDARVLADLQRGSEALAQLDRDTGLLDILPVLRAVAANVPAGGDVTRELDHWRSDDYVKCDNFDDTMNRHSIVRQTLLGETLRQRRATPIAPLQHIVIGNVRHVEFANGEMQTQLSQPLSKL